MNAAVAARAAVTGAAAVRGLSAALLARPPGGAAHWTRTNHRGRQVTLLSGPALAAAVALCSDLPRSAALVAGVGAGAIGAYDDATGARHPRAKGFRGHAAALRAGRITGGAVKVAGIGASSLLATRLLGRQGAVDLLVGGAVVAGAANLGNLLDLRPGRALKAGTATALALHQPAVAGATLALLPDDLGEQAMLGDCGANALGAVLGLALLQRHPERRRAVLAGLVALTAASEVVSYSRVIDAVPPLRWFDRLGRQP